MGNSDVKLRHKVQLRKKAEEPKQATPERPAAPRPADKRFKAWIWICCGIILCGIIGYSLFTCLRSAPDAEKRTAAEAVESAEIPVAAESADTAASEAPASEKEPEETTPNDIESTVTEQSPAADPQAVQTPESPAVTSSGRHRDTIDVSNDIEAEAMKVIRGDYGVGQERKDKLGSKYQPIQDRVNELKREGIF